MSKKMKQMEETTVAKNKKIFWIGGVLIALCIISLVLIIVEESGKNKLLVANNTTRNLEYVKLQFASMDTDYKGTVFFNEALNAGQKITEKTTKQKLYSTQSRLFVIFKFEGQEEKSFDNGWFDHDFSGKTFIEFSENEAGELELSVSIKEGFINGGNYNECDEHWNIK